MDMTTLGRTGPKISRPGVALTEIGPLVGETVDDELLGRALDEVAKELHRCLELVEA
jgi:hypothetical protein